MRSYRSILAEIAILLLLAVISGAATWALHPDTPAWNRKPLDEGAIRLESVHTLATPILWVDARSVEDFETDHVPGAILLNEDIWDDGMGAFLDHWSPETTVVVYCSSDGCQASKHVARRLREEMQIDNIYYLEGGWETWQADNR